LFGLEVVQVPREFELFFVVRIILQKGTILGMVDGTSLGAVFGYGGRTSMSLFTTNSIYKISPEFPL
jgi:hypothetical protein